ncbi:bifunctional metallophosphatase/5'-nucleotidase [Halomarina litorea]|uniref:bifunctional metallophosphatase/5'-nucleotidase n=1 Tax=Halomarina litorea TaxID=2961595 RepID=UPI0020C3053B|nr:5'-nucleotidase C-terminal domain-containing protein [Halomarina sp. BCD28]
MRRLLHLLLVCCLVTAGAVPAVGLAAADSATDASTSTSTPALSQDAANNSTTVTLLTYNDVQTAAARDGNFPRLVELVEQRRAAIDNPVVVAGAGDQIGPHPLSPVSQWRLPVAVLNQMDPAADVIGNHEFDYGYEAISNVTDASRFPWLATNVVKNASGEPFDGTESYEIVEKDGVRVGFIGLVDEGATYGKTTIDFAGRNVTVEDFREVGPRTAEMLKEEKDVDVVVALAHTGVPEAKDLAEADAGAIDVIAVGDDEVKYPPQETSDTVITEAVARAEFLGELNLTVENGDVTAWNGRLINVTDDLPKDETASRLVEGYRANASLDKNLTNSTVALDARFATNYHEESNYGNLVTDAMRAEGNATVAITNAGGIRSNAVYGPGPITGGDVFSTLPFANTLVTVELTGAELKEVLASQLVTLESETGQQYGEEVSQQVSGVRFEWVPHENASDPIRDVYVNRNAPREDPNWVRLDEEATYTVAVNSYMASGGSSYPLENATVVSETDQLLAEAVVDYVDPRETISPTVEGRMQRVDATLDSRLLLADGNGKAVLTFDAPAGLQNVSEGTFVLANGAGETVEAEQVIANGNRLTVRFDDGEVRSLVDSEFAELQLYGEYATTEYDFVYFDGARLNADVFTYAPSEDAGADSEGDGESDEEDEEGGEEESTDDAEALTGASLAAVAA